MSDKEQDREHAAGVRGAKVREAIGKMLSNEQVEAKARADEGETPVSGEKPVTDEVTCAAVEKHVGEIERHVGELVGDPDLECEGCAREESGTRNGGAPER